MLKMSSRLSRVSFGSFDETGNFSLDLPKNPDKPKRKISQTPSNATSATSYEKKPGFGLINFFALRVLIFDIGVALGDVATDFAQVYFTKKFLWEDN